MTMIWIFFFVVFTICVRPLNSSENYYKPPRSSLVWGYFSPPLLHGMSTRTHQTAMDSMVDLTNNLGVTILRDHSNSKGNFAFSPYGVASVLVVLYEGACGESAGQIHRALGFPFDKDIIRVGFRNIHRHLRSYFSHEGYLSGISLNKEGSALKPEFKRILKFYGYDVDVNHPLDEDISLEDLTSPASPSGGAIANSNVTSPSQSEVTENDNQSMNRANTTKESNGNKIKDVIRKPGKNTTKKPESTTKDGNDSGEKVEEKPNETGDDHGNDTETEKLCETSDDESADESEEKPNEMSDVGSAEGGKETPDKRTKDANDSGGTEEEKSDETGDDHGNDTETEKLCETSDGESADESKEKPNEMSDVDSAEGGKETPDKRTKDANDSSGTGDEKPAETGDDHGNDTETEKPCETSEDDESAHESGEKSDEMSDVDSAEGGKETPDKRTKDANDSSGTEEEKPAETGDDHGNDTETEKPCETSEDDESAHESAEKSDEMSDVDSAEGGKETPDKRIKDANDCSGTEDEKPAGSEKNQNNKPETENFDKTPPENVSGVEEDEENSEMTGEDGNDNSSDAEKEGADDTANGKETENSDKTLTQDRDTSDDEDKQNSEDGNDSNEEPNPTEDLSQVPERENEKVCARENDCENKRNDDSAATTTTTGKQEPEEMSITTLSDGLVLNKTEPTEEVEDLQVTSSAIKNSEGNSETSETGVSTPETESEDSMSENLESPLTSTMAPYQEEEEEEVTKVTESSDTEEATTKPNLDNGMLIPQPDDLPTSSELSTTEEEGNHESTTPETSAESKTDATEEGSPAEVTTSNPHLRRKRTKRSSPIQEKVVISNRLRPVNQISVWVKMNVTRVPPRRQTRRAFHPKLSAPYQMRNGKTITDYLKSPPASDVSLQLQNGMFDSHVSRNLELYKSLPRIMFLVDGAIDTPVPMMTYTHEFPFAYIPRLHAKALEFPLDDVRYKLLILLPVERRGLRQLIYDLTEFPLREVFTALEPTRVRAMIPPFMVEGFVILTSSLQKLGIWDVFDPRKSNLSGMSIDPELYVRNVEQSVTVVIRNYVEILDIQTRTMAARNIEDDFEATHPFLYFVLDTETNVALMAGQILDPLNSRIY